MELIKFLFGEGKDLDALQMSCRAIAAFFVALVLIRVGGQRTFGKRSAFDNVLMIMLGAVLSRAVVGASPALPVIAACTAMSIVHRLLAWISLYSDTVGKVVKGKACCLFENGRYHHANMKRSLITEKDIMEGVRLQAGSNSLDEVDRIFIERSGQISVVKKKDQPAK